MNLIRRQSNAKSHRIAIGQESVKTYHCESTVVVRLVGWLNICFYISVWSTIHHGRRNIWGRRDWSPPIFDKLAGPIPILDGWIRRVYSPHRLDPTKFIYIPTTLIYITLATQSSNQKAFRFSTSGHVVLEKIKVPKYLARKRQMAPELARAIELRHKLLSLAGIACCRKDVIYLWW